MSLLRADIMTFTDRIDAGQQLGRYLARHNLQADLVLGLPRGGVVIAAEVARILHRPLDALVVRKIGHPRHREFAVGALAEDGTLVLDDTVLAQTEVSAAALQEVIAEETARLAGYRAKFLRPERPSLKDKTVLIVDDGLATGATMEVAVRSAKTRQANGVTVAVPVASENSADRLARVADNVLALLVDPGFDAVGRYYRSFPQTTDEEVMKILGTAGWNQSGQMRSSV